MLPPALQQHFSDWERTLVDNSILADLRKADDPAEAPKHYLNLDAYGDYPFPDFTVKRDILEKRWGRETVSKNGTLLWTIESTYHQLVDAFRQRDEQRIVQLAADLSHYVADLHQPFHAALNYNGQLTNQHGIHFRFEGDLFLHFQHRVSFRPRALERFDTVKGQSLAWIKESFLLVESILEADAAIVSELRINRRNYRKGNRTLPYPDEYYRRLWEKTGDLLVRRLNQAAWAVASLWHMAWQEGTR